jgi:protein-S-isoprenylcysteine O-methyltransferase Ste14
VCLPNFPLPWAVGQPIIPPDLREKPRRPVISKVGFTEHRMRVLELKVPPPVVALLIGAAMWFASPSGPSLELSFLVRGISAIVVAVLGGAVSFAGDLQFRRAKTTVNPLRPENASSLVTSGIYRFTRNPMYLGLLFVVVGWAVFLSSAWALVGPVVFVLYIGRFQIAPEERVLSAKFGAAYSNYTSQVRRWL